MTKTRMQVLFMDLVNKTGLEGHVGVESLRRSLAAHMLEQGVDVGQMIPGASKRKSKGRAVCFRTRYQSVVRHQYQRQKKRLRQ